MRNYGDDRFGAALLRLGPMPAGLKGMLSVSHDCYWRCREMSLPLDPSVLGGFRRNRAGRTEGPGMYWDLLGCVGIGGERVQVVTLILGAIFIS